MAWSSHQLASACILNSKVLAFWKYILNLASGEVKFMCMLPGPSSPYPCLHPWQQPALPKHSRRGKEWNTEHIALPGDSFNPWKCHLAAAFKPSQLTTLHFWRVPGSSPLMIWNLRYLFLHLQPKAGREVLWSSLEDAGITPNEWSVYSGIKVICDDWCLWPSAKTHLKLWGRCLPKGLVVLAI